MKKSIVILLHAGFWLSYFLLLSLILAAASNGFTTHPSGGKIASIITGFIMVPSAIAFYTFYGFLFPKFLRPRKIGALAGMAVLVSFGAALVGAGTVSILLGGKIMFGNGIASFFGELLTMSVIALLCGIAGLILKGFISWYDDIQVKAELQEKNHEMELALVKAQLDPHFLFNTLNNIDVLIQQDADRASAYLNQLSDILRFMLFEGKTDKIELSREILYLEKYIALQKVRSSNPDFVAFTVTGKPDGHQVAPLIFLPFVENAFKHVSDKKMNGAITIRLDVQAKSILFECTNICRPGQDNRLNSSGLGNDLIQKRLALLYPNHQLEMGEKSGQFRVMLKFPVK